MDERSKRRSSLRSQIGVPEFHKEKGVSSDAVRAPAFFPAAALQSSPTAAALTGVCLRSLVTERLSEPVKCSGSKRPKH